MSLLQPYTSPSSSQTTKPFPEGRLQQASLNLLEGADIQFRRENRLDIALVKNLPIALVFLPAADIPTFVGEGQVDLGITGYDQVQEYEACVRGETCAHATSDDGKPRGCETVMDLGFGACKLQVQVPVKGGLAKGEDLIGKNIGTSFVHLTEEYFANLERAQDGGKTNGEGLPPGRKSRRTKIIELSGSVEAACALGVADGIVDLVGMWTTHPFVLWPQIICELKGRADWPLYRVRRDHEGSRSQANRHSGGVILDSDQVKNPNPP